MNQNVSQANTDSENIEFWNELCGTGLAKSLGIADSSRDSLKRFDDWYLDFYRYLYDYVKFDDVADRKVLEIGLGYGTLAQLLMERGAEYYGLDIAQGPVDMARYRAGLLHREADIRQGSALAIPFADGTFDYIVTIGCLHHTGDMAGAFEEVHRCLKPGGSATIMIYNALSYRHWQREPVQTLRRAFHPDFLWTNADPSMRMAYDANAAGSEAPQTTFASKREIRSVLGRLFSSVDVSSQNIGGDFLPARYMSRERALRLFGGWLGLDLYINCQK